MYWGKLAPLLWGVLDPVADLSPVKHTHKALIYRNNKDIGVCVCVRERDREPNYW